MSIEPFIEFAEHIGDGRVVDGIARVIHEQILLGYVGLVVTVVILSQQVVERLVFARANVRGNRLVPFLCVSKFWVDVIDNASERKKAMFDDLANTKLRFGIRFF